MTWTELKSSDNGAKYGYDASKITDTAIETQAFFYCKSLTSIVIPSGVTTIGESAFMQCSNLTSITIPNGVTSIGVQAFVGSNLTSVEIPSSITTIGDSAFAGSSSLTCITFNSTTLPTIGDCAFNDVSSTGEFKVPSGMTQTEKDKLTIVAVGWTIKEYSSGSTHTSSPCQSWFYNNSIGWCCSKWERIAVGDTLDQHMYTTNGKSYLNGSLITNGEDSKLSSAALVVKIDGDKIYLCNSHPTSGSGTCETCGETYGPTHTHSWAEAWTTDSTNHWHACTGDNNSTDCLNEESAAKAAHSGGTATCQAKAVCSTCNQEYGELAAHSWGSWDAATGTRSCTTAGCTQTDTCTHNGATTGTCSTCGKTVSSSNPSDRSTWPTEMHTGCAHSSDTHFYLTGVTYQALNATCVEGRNFTGNTSYTDLYDESSAQPYNSNLFPDGTTQGWYYYAEVPGWGYYYLPCFSKTATSADDVKYNSEDGIYSAKDGHNIGAVTTYYYVGNKWTAIKPAAVGTYNVGFSIDENGSYESFGSATDVKTKSPVDTYKVTIGLVNRDTTDFSLVDGHAYEEFTHRKTNESTLHIEGLTLTSVKTEGSMHTGLIVKDKNKKLEEGEDKDYTVTEGSLKVNLNKSYLDTLEVGEHIIDVYVDKVNTPTDSSYDYKFDVKVKILCTSHNWTYTKSTTNDKAFVAECGTCGKQLTLVVGVKVSD